MEAHIGPCTCSMGIESQLTDLKALCELLELTVSEFTPNACDHLVPLEPLHFLSGEVSRRIDALDHDVLQMLFPSRGKGSARRAAQ